MPTYTPMIPTLVSKPFHRNGWVYGEKVDGYRMPAYKHGRSVRLLSRHGVDHARRYLEVAAAVGRLKPTTLILDGELAVFDQQLRSRFDWLRHRQPPGMATPRSDVILYKTAYVSPDQTTSEGLARAQASMQTLSTSAFFGPST